MSNFAKLKKTVEALKRVTAGRHPQSPGVSVAPAANPGKPKDIPHIREDSQSVVNFKLEKSTKADSPESLTINDHDSASQEFQNDVKQGEYVNARKSKFKNLGEDITRSARHKAEGRVSTKTPAIKITDVSKKQLLQDSPIRWTGRANDHNNHSKALLAAAMIKTLPENPALPSYVKNMEDENAHMPFYGASLKELKDSAKHHYTQIYNIIKDVAHKELDNPDTDLSMGNAYAKPIGDYIRQNILPFRSHRYAAKGIIAYYNKMARGGASKEMNNYWMAKKAATEKANKPMDYGIIHAKQFAHGVPLSKIFGVTGISTGVAKASGKAERIGPDHGMLSHEDHEKLLTGEMKLRGLQYGNSVSDSEREHHLKHSATALKDLVDILGLPHAMASYNGKLGLAIGARGKGKALAHYEPGLKVINITNKNGSGSLAHEWAHAFDHMLGDLVGSGNQGYLSLRSHHGVALGGETDKKIAGVLSKIQKNLGEFRSRMRQNIPQGVSWNKFSNYWGTTHEMFARSFEKYIKDKLDEKGRKNTYLVDAPDHPFWPNESESRNLNPLFDELFDIFKNSEYLHKSILWMNKTPLQKTINRVLHALKKSDKIKVQGIVSQIKPETGNLDQKKNSAYGGRFENKPNMLPPDKNSVIDPDQMDHVESHKINNDYYHHVGVKGNHTYHTLSGNSSPTGRSIAQIMTARKDGVNYIRAAHADSLNDNAINLLRSHVQSKPEHAYTEPMALKAHETYDPLWEGHNSHLVNGIIPDKTLQVVPPTLTPWVSLAGVEGDSTPRVIMKESLSRFDHLKPGDESKAYSYFNHKTFNTAHREAAYSKLAHEIFGLGQYVPKATVFVHPLSGRTWSSAEFIPGARQIEKENRHKDLKEIKDNGDIYKMALMNTILGNNDRHLGNMLKDAGGKIHLIDHGSSFDYNHATSNILPAYIHDEKKGDYSLLDEDVPESVHQWLWDIDGAKLAKQLKDMGAPNDTIMHAVMRLADAKSWSTAVKNGSKHYPNIRQGIRYALEAMRARQFRTLPEEHNMIVEDIRKLMLKERKPKEVGDRNIPIGKIDANDRDNPQDAATIASDQERTIVKPNQVKPYIDHPNDEVSLNHEQDAVTQRYKDVK
jgi:hypothetical protein